jgi:hypothetical protein
MHLSLHDRNFNGSGSGKKRKVRKKIWLKKKDEFYRFSA